MGQKITPITLTSPGYFGINTQDSPTDMDPRFALQANNCVIDKSGRIACRKGWEAAHATLSALGTSDVECITELIISDGSSTILAAGNNKLFKLASGTLSELTYGGGGVAPTITGNKWQTATLNDIELFYQTGHDPLIYDPTVSTTMYRRLSEKSGSTGTVYQCNTVLSAYGRIWAADSATDKSTLVFSDLLTPHIWTGGTAGNLDLRKVWPSGGDRIMALAAHNNQLFIFGRRQILVYSGADDPATMKLTDHVDNIGCVNRDTVQNTGEDIIFLSDSGVRSLMRTIQEKSSPMRTISRNVSDDIQQYINAGTSTNFISAYSPSDNFYLLTFGDNNITYCFDLKTVLQDGSNRVTTWSLITPKCYMYSQDRTLYLGQSGYIGTYGSYKDNGTTFRMSYYTGWIDFGNPISYAILKKIRMTLSNGQGQRVVFKWGFDYVSPVGSSVFDMDSTESSEYNISEYAIAEYNIDTNTSVVSTPASGVGRVCQVGFESQINTHPISVQKIDIYIKEGRF